MEALLAELRSPRDAAMMNIVLADSVYTPTRACIRGVAGGGGGAAVKRGLQVVWGCTRRLDALYPTLSTHPSIAKWTPDCLQYIGNVPEGWLQRPGSHEMDAEHLWGLRMQLQAAAK